jgi:hypothetical protein
MYRQAFDTDFEMKYRFLRDLGFANQTTPIDVRGTKVIPFQVLWAQRSLIYEISGSILFRLL